MSRRRRIGRAMLAAAAAIAAAAAAGTTTDAAVPATRGPASPSLEARLEALERTVARLRSARDAADPLGRVRARRDRAVRALVADALADAGTRAAWRDAASGFGGWDGRPVLRSADGRHQLGLALHAQVRFAAGRLGQRDPGDDGTVAGFELRRTRLKAVGHVLDARLRFQLGGGFSTDGDPFSITDAWTEWRGGGLAVRVGRFRPVFLREEQTSAKRLPGIERSLVSRLVRQPRRTGAMLAWRAGPLRLHAAVQDPGGPEPDAWQASLRGEWRLAGGWRDLRQETGFPGGPAAGAIGGGVLREAVAGAPDRTQATVDLLWVADGWSLTLVGVLEDPPGAERRWGATARVGRFVGLRTELAGRVQLGDAEDELLAVGAGVTWHVHGHDLKLQADVLHAFDGPGGAWRTSSTGWRPEAGDGQTVLRMQVQVAY